MLSAAGLHLRFEGTRYIVYNIERAFIFAKVLLQFSSGDKTQTVSQNCNTQSSGDKTQIVSQNCNTQSSWDKTQSVSQNCNTRSSGDKTQTLSQNCNTQSSGNKTQTCLFVCLFV